MASTLPSSSSAPTSPPSISNSDNSAPQPSPPKPLLANAETGNGVDIADDEKPDQTDQFDDLDGQESIEKFHKFEADYTHRLMAKYFSQKNLYGADMFDEDITIDNEIIKSSRWPCTRSFADPVRGFEDRNGSCSITESPHNITYGKLPLNKNGL